MLVRAVAESGLTRLDSARLRDLTACLTVTHTYEMPLHPLQSLNYDSTLQVSELVLQAS